MRKGLSYFLFVCLILGCHRKPLTELSQAMRKVAPPSTLSDDLGHDTLIAGLNSHISYFEKNLQGDPLNFGDRVLSREQYLKGLKRVRELSLIHDGNGTFWNQLKEEFDFYEVYGGDRWGEVLLTSYYEPVIPGSKKKSEQFSAPLMLTPKDLISVKISKFDRRFSEIRTMRGRMEKDKETGKEMLFPYPDRKEIFNGALDKKSLEICWVDPIEGFFLQVQGSGRIHLSEGGDLRLGYDDQNGHPYVPIGKFLTDVIPLKEMTLGKIEAHLRSIDSIQRDRILNENPSYVFFRVLKGEPVTAVGTEVIAGRTIATDARFFPKGTLGFLSFESPVFQSEQDEEPVKWEKKSRLVFDQDTGGAIRGGGRVDLFWGSGLGAKQHASVMKNPARLYYLAPKLAESAK